MKSSRKGQELDSIPAYTGSLDAKIPAENIVLSHYMAETEQWVVASQGSDGAVFMATAPTEPLARRAAGLRTLAHLQARAEGSQRELTASDIEKARLELVAQLNHIGTLVRRHNGAFPAERPQDVVLTEFRASADLVAKSNNRPLLARWVLPPLQFAATSFADGIIGAAAGKALEVLTKILAG